MAITRRRLKRPEPPLLKPSDCGTWARMGASSVFLAEGLGQVLIEQQWALGLVVQASFAGQHDHWRARKALCS